MTPPLLIPASWSAETGAQPAARPQVAHWWTRLNDPVLDALIENAVDCSLDIAATRAAKLQHSRPPQRPVHPADASNVERVS